MTNVQSGFAQACTVLPPELRALTQQMPDARTEAVEEIRLRVGKPPTLRTGRVEYLIGSEPVNQRQLDTVLELASQHSVHAVMDQLRNGYLSIEGGHRLGICGTAVTKEKEIYTLRQISSINIRIARAVQGVAELIMPKLLEQGQLQSTLVLAPPGLGKTTLLRDLIRSISDGIGMEAMSVGLADERGEVAAMHNGEAQLNVGARTDVIQGCTKAQGLILLLRGMNPGVLAADEITAQEDVEALIQASGCGVCLLATAHGATLEDLQKRPVYQTLIRQRVFSRLVTISQSEGGRHYDVQRI